MPFPRRSAVVRRECNRMARHPLDTIADNHTVACTSRDVNPVEEGRSALEVLDDIRVDLCPFAAIGNADSESSPVANSVVGDARVIAIQDEHPGSAVLDNVASNDIVDIVPRRVIIQTDCNGIAAQESVVDNA